MPSDATVGDVPREGTGGGDSTGTGGTPGGAPGGGLDNSHVDGRRHGPQFAGEEKPFRLEAGPTETGKPEEEELLLPLSASSSDLLRLTENFPGMHAVEQFELMAMMNRWNDAEKAAYLAISLRGPAATVLTNLLLNSAEVMKP